MSCRMFVGLLALVCSISPGASALAVPLRVDFGTTDSPVQSGYSQFGRGLTSPQHNVLAAQTETFSGITVTVAGTSTADCPNCGTGWRNRAAISGTFAGLSNLLGDEVKSNGVSSAIGDSLFLTLSGLAAGTWEITTYHHSGRTNGSGVIDIYRVGNPTPLVSDLTQSVGTSPSSIATATLAFFADGVNDVTFEYREVAVDNGGAEAVLSGFDLDLLQAFQVPEPSSFSLLAGALLGMMGLRRRGARRR